METAVQNPYSPGRDNIIEIVQLKYKMNTYINICQGNFFHFNPLVEFLNNHHMLINLRN